MTEYEPLELSMPAPAFRPGDVPDFSDRAFTLPGAVRLPPVDEEPEDMRDLAFQTIRVLTDDGVAVGPWAPKLSPEELIAGVANMLRVRVLDRRMMNAQRQAKTSFYMRALGEEAVACAFQTTLEPGDMSFPTYRQQGLLVTAGYPLVDMMNQIFSNEADPLKGRQLPIMYSSRAHGFFSISGNLATQFVQAVGWAMASAIKGEKAIATGWIGEGSTAESDFHSAMVFASTYGAPVVLNIVNNQWAISTYQGVARGHATTFAARGVAFGIPALRVDGNDYLAVYAAARWATERARRSLGPTLIEWVTYRAGAHSSSDDPSAYRPKSEASSWPLGDPIERLTNHLIMLGAWTMADYEALEVSIEAEVLAAQTEAEAHGTMSGGPNAPRDIFEDVYEEMPARLIEQREEAGYS
jgi:2-oxoisovalerate dehydrogenase E1 component alpha subunit